MKKNSKWILIVNFIIIICIFIGVVGYSLKQLNIVKEEARQVVIDNIEKSHLIILLSKYARERVVSLFTMLVLDDPFEVDDEYQLFQQYGREFIKNRRIYLASQLTDKESNILVQQAKYTDIAVPIQRQVIEHIQQDEKEEAIVLLLESGLESQAHVLEQFNSLIDFQKTNTQAILKKIDDRYQQNKILVLVWSVIAFILLIVIFLKIIRKITQSEKDLFDEMENTRATLSSINDMILRINNDNTIVYINHKAETFFDYPILNLKIGDVLNFYNSSISSQNKHSGDNYLGRYFLESKHHKVWVELRYAEIKNNNGDLTGKVIVLHDVSEVIKVQSALKSNNENLEQQVNRRTKEIEAIHKKTHDSIQYAALIQGSLIPDEKILKAYFKDTFSLWLPKDIVGGDIFLVHEISPDELLIMVIDCTGHGVPGAFVSMLVKAVERQITANLHKDDYVSPSKILSIFNRSIKNLLKQEDDSSLSNVGFDGAIVYYNRKDKVIKFAGAETPLNIIQKGKLQVIKGCRHSIGYKKSDSDFKFKEHFIDVSQPTHIYLSTDGYIDQNGGNKGFCFGRSRLTQLLKQNYQKTYAQQKSLFLDELSTYQGEEERNDDITMLGLFIDGVTDVPQSIQREILSFHGVITQNFISACMDNIEYKVTNMATMGNISTIVIELCQNMMNYSKSKDKDSRQIEPFGFIEVLQDNDNYCLTSKNILSIDDKIRIEPKLIDIQSMDQAGIKKRYRELRRSGQHKHEKGGGIGLYEIAKLTSNISYEFETINEDKYYYTLKATVSTRKRKNSG